MLNIYLKEPNMVGVDLDGSIDAAEMAVGLDALIELCDGMEGGGMFYRITDFQMPTLNALAVEFRKLPQLFRLVRSIDKAAVLTNQGWIKTVSELEGALIPGLEIKAFDLDEEDAALDYLHNG